MLGLLIATTISVLEKLLKKYFLMDNSARFLL